MNSSPLDFWKALGGTWTVHRHCPSQKLSQTNNTKSSSYFHTLCFCVQELHIMLHTELPSNKPNKIIRENITPNGKLPSISVYFPQEKSLKFYIGRCRKILKIPKCNYKFPWSFFCSFLKIDNNSNSFLLRTKPNICGDKIWLPSLECTSK